MARPTKVSMARVRWLYRPVMREARVGAHMFKQLVTVHARHLDVQQHQIWHAVMQLFDGVQAVLGRHDLDGMVTQHARSHFAHGDGVVHHHNQRFAAVFLDRG